MWFLKLLEWFDYFIINVFHDPHAQLPEELPMNMTPEPKKQPVQPPEPEKTVYEWSTPEKARHSCRVIADEEGLTVEQKNTMSRVINCESGYHIKAVHPNVVNGKTVSTDRGICQWNDFYHGKEISPDEAFNNPEKCVRLMCKYVKAGQIRQWVCFSSGLYQKYSP